MVSDVRTPLDVGTEYNIYFLDSKRESGIKLQTTQGNIFNTELSKIKGGKNAVALNPARTSCSL